jgi:hypothetical protein
VSSVMGASCVFVFCVAWVVGDWSLERWKERTVMTFLATGAHDQVNGKVR